MMDYLWAGMILAGVLYGALAGNLEPLTEGTLGSAGEAVSLCITMVGVMSLWMGLMNVAKKAGLLDRMTYAIQPLVSFLFPRIPKDHPARVHISTNLVANILGLGWACTPAGLKAMEALADLEEERYGSGKPDAGHSERNGSKTMDGGSHKRERIASNEMCDFLILNISSLQLVPVNLIAYRMQYGSTAPARIIGPAIAATTISTLTGVLFIKLKSSRKF